MDASPRSIELATRLVPERASRNASRRATASAAAASNPASAAETSAAVTTTVYVVPPPTTAPPVTAARSTATTAKPRSTTTTRKAQPKTTTTKAPAKPSGPPALREATPPAAPASSGQSEIGQATWYKSPDPIGCAHKTIPMGTIVTVTNTDTGGSTTCKVADRGPFIEGKIIDLSAESFTKLAPLSQGVIDVKITW